MNFTYNLSNLNNQYNPVECPLPIDIFGVEKMFLISIILSSLLVVYFLFFQNENHKYFPVLRRVFLVIVLLSLSISLNLYFLR